MIGSIFNFIMYFFSDRLVLRMYGAKVVTAQEAPELYAMVDRLRQRAGLPMPEVAIAPHEQPNAFATGRNPEHAVVAVTTGILKYVPPEELEGVLAHELAHVKNRDMLISTVAAGIAAALSNLPYLLMFGGGRDDDNSHPFAQLGLDSAGPDRSDADPVCDLPAARVRGRPGRGPDPGPPAPLAKALVRLDSLAHQIPMQVPPAVAPLAQVNPLAADGGVLAKLFSTHPPTPERVARLESMALSR